MSILESVIENVARPLLAATLAGITMVEGVELGVKIMAGVATITVAIIQYLAYRSRKKLESAQLKEIEERLKRNKENE